jgi:hypothetical protein
VEDGEIRISTVDIASWLERPHYNVTREVEKMLQEYENTQQLAALTCEASEYTDPTGRKLSMFVMDIRAAVKFVTRLKGQKPTIVRDKIMDAELRWKAPKTEAPERCARVRAEKPLPGTPIRPRLLSGWKTPRPRAAPDLSRGGFSMEKAPHPAAPRLARCHGRATLSPNAGLRPGGQCYRQAALQRRGRLADELADLASSA